MFKIALILILIITTAAFICESYYLIRVRKILLILCPEEHGFPKLSSIESAYRNIEKRLHDLYRDDDTAKERELVETRMKFIQLQNQINPHFLYNTLENIRARAILDDNEVIADMTEALSRFFRYNISKREDIVRLSEELDNIRTYIRIQQYRFAGKFDFRVYIHDEDSGVLNTGIPKMTLQPVVENAIFHGMEEKIGKGHIEIHIESDTETVSVLIEDDGVGMDPYTLRKLQEKMAGNDSPEEQKDGNGIAMVNINKRLKLIFGEEYGVTVSSIENVGTEVSLTLPIHRTESQEESRSA